MVDFVYPILKKEVTTCQFPITDLKQYVPNIGATSLLVSMVLLLSRFLSLSRFNHSDLITRLIRERHFEKTRYFISSMVPSFREIFIPNKQKLTTITSPQPDYSQLLTLAGWRII